MARPPRIVLANGIYHVTARGNRHQLVFGDRRDYECYLDFLREVVARCGWRLHSYCLMPNHVHLVVETPVPNLSEGMQRLHTRYAQWFNHRHGFDGHLFQGRFHSRLVESHQHFIELCRYVVLNPVRAGLCATAGDWEWSSYRALAGLVRRPAFLTVGPTLDQFGTDRRRARERFAQFVAEGRARPPP